MFKIVPDKSWWDLSTAIDDITRTASIKKVNDETNIADRFKNLNYEDSLKLYYKLYPKKLNKNNYVDFKK